jgi:hypothetical protein
MVDNKALKIVPQTGTDPTKIPPRTLNERLRLAIRWSRGYHAKQDDPDGELAGNFIRQLGHVGLKLVWTDGRELTPEQIHDKRKRRQGRADAER